MVCDTCDHCPGDDGIDEEVLGIEEIDNEKVDEGIKKVNRKKNSDKIRIKNSDLAKDKATIHVDEKV